jgi:hypothetical protein
MKREKSDRESKAAVLFKRLEHLNMGGSTTEIDISILLQEFNAMKETNWASFRKFDAS